MTRATLTPLDRILAADERIAGWNRRRLREAAVQAVLRRALPRPVGERVFVVGAEAPALELATPSGAVASVVRQQGPELLGLLRREGFEFSGIRLRVQPRPAPPQPQKSLPRQWDSASRRPLAALEQRLPAGPLKAAVARFLRGR
ncbi:MAG: hypothetical protein KJ018_17425 [Burkholderiales bacterium]|nr:hypothetical protein [Burkholderiales bacterium]